MTGRMFAKAHEADDLAFGTIDSSIAYCMSVIQLHVLSLTPVVDGLRQNLLDGVSTHQHIGEATDASRTLLLHIRTLDE